MLAKTSSAQPKTATGASAMLRELKLARDTAVKARTQAMLGLKGAGGDDRRRAARRAAAPLQAALRDRCAALRPGPITTPLAAGKHALRALARRWQQLDAQIAAHDALLDQLTAQAAPRLRAACGIGPDIAAELLILAGNNPQRIRSDAAFAQLTGTCPIPASSGPIQRHRLNPAGHRQANSALYRCIIIRMRFHQPTIDYVTRRTTEGKSKREIPRCLKRYLAREIYHALTPPPTPQRPTHKVT